MESDKMDELIDSFTGITGASRNTALFYLEGANGDLQAAAEHYFEQNDVGDDPMFDDASDPSFADAEVGEEAKPAAASVQQPSQSHAKAKSAPKGRVRGFADLNNSDSDDEDNKGNEYYTGGEKSGQVVKGNDNKESVAEYFERVRKQDHASDGPVDNGERAEPSGAFTGRARRLEDSGPAEEEAAPITSSAGAQRDPDHVVITFYADRVFTVNDGEPRNVKDPANRAFLEQLSRGQAPDELIPKDGMAGDISVELKRSMEEYKPPKAKPFSGKSRTLAGDSAGPSRTPSASQAAPVAAPSPSKVWEGVDESKPTTSLQLRLADGSRMVARFNVDHTIGDIRRFIGASDRQSPSNYRLATAFPAAELTDNSKTISEAGLQNAVIIQKL